MYITVNEIVFDNDANQTGPVIRGVEPTSINSIQLRHARRYGIDRQPQYKDKGIHEVTRLEFMNGRTMLIAEEREEFEKRVNDL